MEEVVSVSKETEIDSNILGPSEINTNNLNNQNDGDPQAGISCTASTSTKINATVSSALSTSTPSKSYEDSDSDDSCNLQIVLPNSATKRKRANLIDFDQEIEDDILRELQKRPKKSSLTVRKVKNILRYVIGNESILAMVRKSMKNEGGDQGLEVEPKLTRAKTKILREEAQILWPLSPIPLVPPENNEHLVLIREELPEEEDDEDYRPTLDDLQEPSDDESGRQSVGTPNLDISSASRYLESFDPRLLDDNNGSHNYSNYSMENGEQKTAEISDQNLFKIPEENIGQRTRSKLSLSSTPLETIEQAFIPPDVTTDMYDLKNDDQEWENFLKEFMQPLSNETADGDEEDDPEYNAIGEEEVIDKEELRHDRGVTVSTTELKTLMIELLGGLEDPSSDDEASKENEDRRLQTSTLVPPPSPPKECEVRNNPKLSPPPPTPPPPPEPNVIGITKNQQLLLMQQIRQHNQLLTQHFVQTHRHPIHSKVAAKCKVMLAELVELSKLNPNSAVNVFNLHIAFQLVEEWERFLDSDKGEDVIQHAVTEMHLALKAKKQSLLFRPTFHPKMMSFIIHSQVFMYPLMLPIQPFRSDNPVKLEFLPSEDWLIALGLEQLVPYLQKYPRWSDGRQGPDRIAADLIHELLLPGRSTMQVVRRIRSMKYIEGNPIWHYYNFNKAPGTRHFVVPFTFTCVLPPKDQRAELLNEPWRDFVYNFWRPNKTIETKKNTRKRRNKPKI